MKLTTSAGELEIVNEPTYTFGSADNVRRYPIADNLDAPAKPCSAHGLFLDGDPLAVFGAVGGATGVHTRSAIYLDDRLYLAICDRVLCLRLNPTEKHWCLSVDPATCFGIHLHAPTNTLISHGELQVTRFTPQGTILWQSSGRDIFTEAFSVEGDIVRAVDFNGYEHRFLITDGHDA
jgi:hypothetical protein